jgi:hypothetical protein
MLVKQTKIAHLGVSSCYTWRPLHVGVVLRGLRKLQRRESMKNLVLGAAALMVAAGAAHGVIIESEMNDSPASANFVGAFGPPGGSVLVDGTITGGGAGIAGDVDWFSFTIGGTATVVTSVFSLDNGLADSELWLVAGDGTTIIAYNDDGNPGGGAGGMSSLITIGLAPGNYFLALSGWDDGGFANSLPDGFNGSSSPAAGGGVGHGENFTYKLLLGFNVVPTPGAAALMGLGALAAGRRRR